MGSESRCASVWGIKWFRDLPQFILQGTETPALGVPELPEAPRYACTIWRNHIDQTLALCTAPIWGQTALRSVSTGRYVRVKQIILQKKNERPNSLDTVQWEYLNAERDASRCPAASQSVSYQTSGPPETFPHQ